MQNSGIFIPSASALPNDASCSWKFNVLISEAGKKILPLSRDLIGETQIGNPGFNGGSSEGKKDRCLSGGWTRSDHSGMRVPKHSDDGCSCGREPGNGPRLACASGLAREVSAVLERSVAEKAAGV
jgi:hypothetical protein